LPQSDEEKVSRHDPEPNHLFIIMNSVHTTQSTHTNNKHVAPMHRTIKQDKNQQHRNHPTRAATLIFNVTFKPQNQC
jgi:hypothetical protein